MWGPLRLRCKFENSTAFLNEDMGGAVVSKTKEPQFKAAQDYAYEIKKRENRWAIGTPKTASPASPSSPQRRKKKQEEEPHTIANSLVLRIGQLDGLAASVSEIYVRVSLCRLNIESGRYEVLSQVRTQRRYNTSKPAWYSFRPMSANAADSDNLLVEVFTCRSVVIDSLLGASDVGVSSLKPGRDKRIPLNVADSQFGTDLFLTVQRVHPRNFRLRKRVFFIRHAESKWNQAQANRDIVGMVKQRDHPLNRTGIQQALKMSNYCNTKETPTNEVERSFLEADEIITSPLCRALQTALVGLYAHPCTQKKGMKLMGNVREIQNLGGIDSMGMVFGSASITRAYDSLRQELAEGSTDDENFMLVSIQLIRNQIDHFDTESEWWQYRKESKKHYVDRIRELIFSIQYGSAHRPIVVLHSLFLRQFFKHISHSLKSEDSQKLMEKLSRFKIENCGCVAVDLEFEHDWPEYDNQDQTPINPSEDEDWCSGPCNSACIVGVQLLWDTQVMDESF